MPSCSGGELPVEPGCPCSRRRPGEPPARVLGARTKPRGTLSRAGIRQRPRRSARPLRLLFRAPRRSLQTTIGGLRGRRGTVPRGCVCETRFATARQETGIWLVHLDRRREIGATSERVRDRREEASRSRPESRRENRASSFRQRPDACGPSAVPFIRATRLRLINSTTEHEENVPIARRESGLGDSIGFRRKVKEDSLRSIAKGGADRGANRDDAEI